MESQEQAQFESIRGNLLKDICINFGLLLACSILLSIIGPFVGIVIAQLAGLILVIDTCHKSLKGAKLIARNSAKATLVLLYGLIVPLILVYIIIASLFLFSGISMSQEW